MVDLPDFLLPPPSPIPADSADTFEGRILDDAAGAGQLVRVRLSPGLATDPCPWIPVAAGDGVFYPKAGDACVVVQPAQGDPWIAGWVPSATVPDVPGLESRQAVSEKNQPDGYAGLDGSGKLITSSLPALAIVDVFTVNSQAAQLALSAQQGDVAVRTDQNKSYIHNGGSAGMMADWTLLATPADMVLSVAGKTGAVTLTASDITNFTAAVQSLLAPPAWVEVGSAGAPAFTNGWVNFGSGYSTAGFYKDPNGRVHLKGIIKSGTAGSAMFTLPTGYRPAENLIVGTVAALAFGSLGIHTSGIVGGGGVTSGSNDWFSLDGISFRAA